jgi:hypothetical protein
MNLETTEARNDGADEDKQQFNRLTDRLNLAKFRVKAGSNTSTVTLRVV